MGATLKGSLAKRSRRWEKRVGKVVERTAEKRVAGGAQRNAPRDTNHLADESIRAERIDEHTFAVIVQTADDTHPEYSRHVEMGTRNAAAQPFLIPAVEAARKPFVDDLRKALN